MSKTPQWTVQAPPGLDVTALNIEDANAMVEAAGDTPLDRGALNAMHRAGWHTADVVIYGECKDLLFKASIGPKRLDLINAWRTSLLKLVEPEAEPMSTAERVLVNLMLRKEPEIRDTPTAVLVAEIREHEHTEHLRELLVELALLVPPGRAYSSEMRQWLLEVARG